MLKCLGTSAGDGVLFTIFIKDKSMEFYNALLVESDSAHRAKLKQAALAVTAFKKAYSGSSITEALRMLGAEDKIDVVFIAIRFGKAEIGSFIKMAKETRWGEDCAYIVVFQAAAQNDSIFAEIMLEGADSILCEPYSVDRLQEIAELANKIKQENMVKRRKAAIALLIGNLVKQLDALSLYASKGFNIKRAKKQFAESCKSLAQFSDKDAFELYLEIATSVFEEATPNLEASYTGPSRRIREKMEQKLREQFEREFGKA